MRLNQTMRFLLEQHYENDHVVAHENIKNDCFTNNNE